MNQLSARGIVIRDKNVLLIYREKDGEKFYSIPGGKKEKNEPLEQTVVRELNEETSISVEPTKCLGSFVNPNKDKEQYLFLCKYIKGQPELGESNEKTRMDNDNSNIFIPQWVPIEEIDKHKIRPDYVSKFFKAYIKNYL